MLSATTLKGEEAFAFAPKAPRRPIHHPPPKLLDNLLRDYVGQHYTYDARGNLLERLDNGKKARLTWDLYDRLTRYEDDRLTADFAYDALGRRVAKYSKAHCPPSPGAGPAWIEQQQRTLNAQHDCGRNIYGWDGDNLAYETRYSDNPGERRLVHYSNRSTLPPRITHRLLTPDSGRLVPTVRTMTPVLKTLSKRPIRRCMPCADTF